MAQWEEHEVRLLKKMYSDPSLEPQNISKQLGRSWEAVKNKANELELLRKRFWTEEEKRLLKKVFYSETKEYICQLFPCRTWGTIRQTAYNLGLKRSKRANSWVNVVLDFTTLDSDFKSYFLGLLYADGSLCKSNYNVSLEWHIRDVDSLKLIRDNLCPTCKIYKRFSKKTGNYYVRISVANKDLYYQLLDFGLYPNKTKTISRPGQWLPQKYVQHFIRGYFDGDGSVIEYKKINDGLISKLKIAIVGTEDLLNFINEWFIAKGGSSKLSLSKIKKSSHAFYLSATGRKAVHFLKLIYAEAEIKLDRKYKIAQKYLDMEKDEFGRSIIPIKK